MSKEIERFNLEVDWTGQANMVNDKEGKYVIYSSIESHLSQLSQYKAHVERLKLAFEQYQQTGFCEIFEEAMSQTPATSLAQVEAESGERASNG